MNARELLKEARGELAKAHDHLTELTAKLPMQYFGLVDGNIIQAEDCLVDKIDAYLVAPSESAMEMVPKIRDWHRIGVDGDFMSNRVSFNLSDSDAAALIEGLQRRVPRAMLEELWECSWASNGRGQVDGGKAAAIKKIVAKHGVVIE